MHDRSKWLCCLFGGLVVVAGSAAFAGEQLVPRRGRAEKNAAISQPQRQEVKTPTQEGQPLPKIVQAPKREAKAANNGFVRIRRNKEGDPLALETSIARYVSAKGKDGAIVDLVSVVHIGERSYYYKLNDRFEEYDAVLYELVKPEDAKVPRPGRNNSDNPLALLQGAMTLVLQLDSQLECIDYTPTNFVHADLSPNQIAEKVRSRGDNMLTLALSIAADMLREQNLQEMRRQQNQGGTTLPEDPVDLFDLQLPSKLKTIMAEQLADMGNQDGLGKTLNTILITDRNEAAIKVLQQQLAAGKKKIAIFYGAAHMPDFEQRLIRDFGMQRQGTEWLQAWDLRPRNLDLMELLNKLAR